HTRWPRDWSSDVCSSDLFAQTPYVDEKSPNQVRKTAALESLHDILRKHSNLHDEYLEIAAIGNEGSVPLLLERLRLDYGNLQREIGRASCRERVERAEEA